MATTEPTAAHAMSEIRALDRMARDWREHEVRVMKQCLDRLDRLDALLPAPTPPEPTPAPETPDALATRLLGDPELFAAVLNGVAGAITGMDKNSIYDELQALSEVRYAHGLRSLAATIAAGSFGK